MKAQIYIYQSMLLMRVKLLYQMRAYTSNKRISRLPDITDIIKKLNIYIIYKPKEIYTTKGKDPTRCY